MTFLKRSDTLPPQDRSEHRPRLGQGLFKVDGQLGATGREDAHIQVSPQHLGPLWLCESRGADFRLDRLGDAHSRDLVVLIQLRGACRVRHGEEAFTLGPDSFCLYPDSCPVQFHMPGEFRQIELRFPARMLAEHFAQWQGQVFTPFACDSGAAALFLGLVKAMLEHGEAGLSKCCLDAIQAMLVMLGSTLRGRTARSRPAGASRMVAYHKARIREFVQAHLANPDLDVAMVAQAVQLSPRYIHRLFADEPMRLMQWILSERLARCLDELVHRDPGQRPISSIAYAWGFNDPAHFSRSFRKRYGVAPRDIQGMTASQG